MPVTIPRLPRQLQIPGRLRIPIAIETVLQMDQPDQVRVRYEVQPQHSALGFQVIGGKSRLENLAAGSHTLRHDIVLDGPATHHQVDMRVRVEPRQSNDRRRGFAILLTLVLCFLSAAGCDEFPTENRRSDTEAPFLELKSEGEIRSLPADGVSTLKVTARIAQEAVRPTRTLRYRTTAGAFVGAGSPETQIDVPFQPDGQAVAVLRSSKSPGPVVLTAQVFEGMAATAAVAQLQLEFVVPDVSSFRFVEAPASAPADGATPSRFAVEVPANLPLDQRTVTFMTSLGSFDGANLKTIMVAAGADGRASVLLYSPLDDGIGELSAAVAGVHRIESGISFRPALAESILVEAAARVAQNQTMAVKATLIRSVGTPTNGTVVTFAAIDSAGNRFGTFRNLTLSNTSGVATAEFRPEGTGTPGRCRLQVRAEGSPAVGRTEFELTAPATTP